MTKTILYIPFHFLIIIAFGILAYANSFENEFLYDDEHHIQRNVYIRDFSYTKDIFTKNIGAGAMRLDNFYRPLQILMYSVVYHIFGLNAFGYHLLNFLLHLSNAFLIYFLTLMLFEKKRLSFISGLLFMVHPVHTEAVTYMNGTADPLMMFFGLLMLIFYLKANKNRIYYFISLICYMASLFSKETAMILPLLIILLDLHKRELNSRRFARYIPYFGLMTGYIFVRSTVFNFTGSLNLFEVKNIYTQNLHYRIFTFLASLIEYYKLLLFPVNLKYDRKMVVFTSLFTPQVFFSLITLLIFFYLAYRSFKSNRTIFLGILWFFISLVPLSGIVPINGFVMEHWLYFPSVGFFTIISYFSERLNFSFKNIGFFPVKVYLPALLIIAVIFSYLIIQRNKDWKDPITFYNKILEHNPDIARVRNNLGMAYTDKGMFTEAEKQYNMAIAIEDRYAETHHNLAQVYLRKGMLQEGISELNKAIAINDNFVYSRFLLKQIYERLGMFEKAKEESIKIEAIISRKKLY